MLRWIGVLITCHVAVIVISPPIWVSVATGYSGDSFWTLSHLGQMGVVVISLTGLVLIAFVNRLKTYVFLRNRPHGRPIVVWALDCFAGLTVFGIVYVLSPQVFYALYQQLIPGLPNQWVIDNAAHWVGLKDVLVPRTGAPLADHLAAVAIWGIVVYTTYLHRR